MKFSRKVAIVLNVQFFPQLSFVVAWRRFIRNPQSNDPVVSVSNGQLLCEHGGLVYPLDLDTESDYESV